MKYRVRSAHSLWRTVLAAAALVSLAVPTARAQAPSCCGQYAQPTYNQPATSPAHTWISPSAAGMQAMPSNSAGTPAAPMPSSPVLLAQGDKPQTPSTPQTPKKETPKEITEQPTPQTQQDTNPEQQAAGGSESVAVATPNVIGDFISFRTVHTPTGATALQAFNVNAGVVTTVRAGVFKVAENENVQPQDRVFFNYNYFSNINAGQQNGTFGHADAHREVIGFEKTFLDRAASVSVRLPFNEKVGDGGIGDFDGFDDLAVVLKYAFILDPEDGFVASGGLVAGAPTGRGIKVPGQSEIHPVRLAPWLGVLARGDAAWFQGFSEIAVPFDSRDATIWFNDLAIGYTIYQDSSGEAFLSKVSPTLEVHINTPLTHRGTFASVIGVPDWVTIVGGSHFQFGERSTLTLGIGTPVTGPKPYDLEAMVQFNWLF